MQRSAWGGLSLISCLALCACGNSETPAGGSGAGAGSGAAAGSFVTGNAGSAASGGTGQSAGATAAGTGHAGGAGAAGGGDGQVVPGPQGGAPGGRAGGGAGMAGTTTPNGTLTAKIVQRNVPPEGQEHVCVVVELSNDAPVWVHRVSATLSGGSHHLIVDRRPATTALNAEPQVCSPTMGGDASRLMIAQQKETSIQLPAGVAFKIEARQRLFLQLHYFNVDETAHDVSGSLELHLFDSSAGTPIEAKNQFTGTMQINIPAHAMSEAKSFHVPPSPNGKRRVFALTSHTHRLGTRATIERVANMNAPEATPLHVSTMWSEPPLTMFDPPLEFSGSDGLRLTCQYQNTTDSAVRFGVEAQDEMCFMWLYYYDAK